MAPSVTETPSGLRVSLNLLLVPTRQRVELAFRLALICADLRTD